MTWRRCAHLAIASIFFSFLFIAPGRAIECAPYARYVSGINLYGDAWSWWHSAEGHYRRGRQPAVGAAMVFRPLAHMPEGHVAVVSQIVNRREVRIDHANWSSGDDRRGAVARGVVVIDVSPRNDWSQVRVWYPPARDLGTHVYPLYGFIYSPRSFVVRASWRHVRRRHG